MHGAADAAEWRWFGPEAVAEGFVLDLGTPDAPLGSDSLQSCLRRLAKGDVLGMDLMGAPAELHPRFTELVILARALRSRVLLRTNLATLVQPGLSDLPALLADHGVDLIAALPWGPYDGADEALVMASLEGLRLLDEAGYGEPGDGGARLDLVAWRPGGTEDGGALERTWRQALSMRGLRFDRLHLVRSVAVTPVQGLAAHLAALVRVVPIAAVLGRRSARP